MAARSEAQRGHGLTALWAGLAVGLVPLGFGLLPGDEATRLERLLMGYALAAFPYVVVVATWRRLPGGARGLALLLGVAVGARLLLLALPPLLSEDVWRYVWDGAMHWAGVHPFRYAPLDPALDGVGLAEIRANIGHAHLPTIYPPAAQVAFAAAAGVSPEPWPFRLLMVIADGLAITALWRWAERTERPPQLAALYAFLPLVMLESAVGGHVDAIAVAATLWAGVFLVGARPVRAGVALAVGVATKLLPVIALGTLLRTAPRAALACVVAVGAVWLPYAVAGEASMGGLSAYGHRWRANGGAFAVVAAPFEAAWPTSEIPLADPAPLTVTFVRAMVGEVEGIPRDQVSTDELSFAAAKATVLLVLLAWWAWLLWRARSFESFLGPAVAGLLLLSPVVHPWYLVWLAPFCALAVGSGRIWGSILLAWPLVAWVAYVPRPEFLRSGVWTPAPWVAWIEYAPVWLGLVIVAGSGLASRPRCGGPDSGTC